MNYVIKIKYEDTLRRLAYSGNRPHGNKVEDQLTFSELEAKIRDLFKIPATAAIRVTYTDKDNDVVTMGDDIDLEDACVLQGLNPLRLDVTLVEVKRLGPSERLVEHPPSNKEAVSNLRQMLQGLPAEVAKPVVDQVQQLLKGTAASPRQIADLVDTVVHRVTSRIDSAVRNVGMNSPAEVLASSGGASGPGTSHSICSSVHHPSIPDCSKLPVGIPVPTPAPTLRTVIGGVSGLRLTDNEAAETGIPCRVFHSGVQCDRCGMNPIVGPRFKATKKHNYDLCMSCFKEAGSPGEYNRIDRPLFRPRHLRCPALNPNFPGRGVGLPTRGPYDARPDVRQAMYNANGGGKLDARFVQDVTIFDGTELAPVTSFTKIWRLRNSGTLSWPLETKLVHVGGDELGSVIDVPLELPENGLSPGEEVKVSVDLVAPEKPGRYVSHWRLASPAGQKFGHRVWVLIQVVPREGYEDAASNVVLSPPTGETCSKEGSVIDGDSRQAASDSQLEDSTQVKAVFSERPSASAEPLFVDTISNLQAGQEGFKGMPGSIEKDLISGDEEYQLYVKDELSGEEEKVNEASVGEVPSSGETEPVPTERMMVEEAPTFVNSELGGFSMVEMPGLVSSSSSATSVSAASVHGDSPSSPAARLSNSSPNDSIVKEEDVFVTTEAEEAWRLTSLGLCEKLEGMGFNDRKLNLELLEKNALDLRRTLDDLFVAAEWDPILEELEEMGFYDVEMNRRLMFKNNGSVKRVVKELVQMYKEPAGIAKDKGKGKEVA